GRAFLRQRIDRQAVVTVQVPGVHALGGGGGVRLRRGAAMVGHRRVAVLAPDRLLAGDAVDEVRVPAPVEQQDRLVFRINRRTEQVLEARRDQVHAATEAV